APPEPLLESLTVTEWLLLVLAVPGLFYLLTWAHELGHAVCGKLAGFLVTACGTGVSRLLFRVRIGGTDYYLAWRQPLQGLTFAQVPSLLPSRGRMALFLSGGILAHAALVLLSLLLLWLVPWGEALWWVLLGLNAIFLLA